MRSPIPRESMTSTDKRLLFAGQPGRRGATKLFYDSACYVTEVPRKAPGPSGPAYPVRAKWQEEVRARLKARGMTQLDLAKIVGCTQPAIAAVLREGAKQSALVPAISKALAMRKPADPSIETVDPVRAELADLLEEMSDEAAKVMLANARLLTGSKKPE